MTTDANTSRSHNYFDSDQMLLYDVICIVNVLYYKRSDIISFLLIPFNPSLTNHYYITNIWHLVNAKTWIMKNYSKYDQLSILISLNFTLRVFCSLLFLRFKDSLSLLTTVKGWLHCWLFVIGKPDCLILTKNLMCLGKLSWVLTKIDCNLTDIDQDTEARFGLSMLE